ncbi:type I polyketide synthase [Actinopolyspora mortivallis]|uniref:Polyketide synthase n=1 Tax=Actinopolyspora mortivallis TaxID=33906 RepID=A0A2T0GT95_ACTMO|nr:type I polyketide synthase [Actinopolyspora mortivallis]PRW62317.1 polyketide synthase [Actinopolyspora mortivallis]
MADHSEIREWLTHRIAEHTGQSPADVDTRRPFDEFGLSSRDVVALSGELESLVSRALPSTLLWEHPTVERLSEALAGASAPDGETTAPEPGEPVAVVGMGCRFPGVNGPEEFWRLLTRGADTIGTVPEGRWESFTAGREEPLEGLPRAGGYFADVSGFDAGFFGVSPREAEVTDPQQRLLLEVAWEALEHAGSAPERLRGSATGVFVGAAATEYAQLTAGNVDAVDAWTGTGAAMSVIANRLSYLLDLRGPSMTVDTACSSSLVALHQACASLRAGESVTALAGGVNLLLSPSVTASFHRAEALAPDGRCKPFDAAADGIVRGEGCGVLVLKLLSHARRDGDVIHAVVRGSAVNSDGRSNGLMAPNPAAQAELLRGAYRAAELDPAVVDYVEAHGTGTLLGDPIEARALGEVLGRGRDETRPVLLGSVKANLGHLEAAAGVAGVLKVVLAMRHGTLPATPNHRDPNPHIPFERDRLDVVRNRRDWPHYSGTKRAGVSGFGFGGTNAHVVLESWPFPATGGDSDDSPHVFVLTGSDERRLRATAERTATWLDGPGEATPPGELAGALLHDRQHHAERAAAVTDDRRELVRRLRSLAEGRDTATVIRGRADAAERGPVWVFSGYGSQWPGMCRQLLRREPELAESLGDRDADFRRTAGFSLYEMLSEGSVPEGLRHVQLALFGTQVALAELWRRRGVEPAAVIGHSMGEVSAAVVAGALGYRTGLRVMETRTRLLAETESVGGGAMAVLEASPSEVESLSEWFPGVAAAVHTSPRRCTVAGPEDEIELIVKHFQRRNRMATVLDVSGAGHTRAVDPLLEPLRTELADLAPSPARVPVYSTAEEDPRHPVSFDASYWARNLRNPVRLDRAVRAAAADGFDTFLEVAPHPIVSGGVEETLTETGVSSPVVAFSCHRDDEVTAFRENLARLLVGGHVDTRPTRRRVRDVALPPTAWHHESFWFPARGARRESGEHPLLGRRAELPDGGIVWRGDVGTRFLPWLGDHRVHDTGVLPGTACVEMVLVAAAAAARRAPQELTLRELELDELLVLDTEVPVTTRAVPGAEEVTVDIHSGSHEEGWIRHATARVSAGDGRLRLTTCERPPEQAVQLYSGLRSLGQEYGPAFRPVESVRAGGGRAVAELALPSEAGSAAGFRAHPALLDGCLQTLVAAGLGPESPLAETELCVPVRFSEVRVRDALPGRIRCHSRLEEPDGSGEVRGSLLVTDDRDHPVAEIGQVRARGVAATPVSRECSEAFLLHRWREQPQPEPQERAGSWLLFGAPDELAERLRELGQRVSVRGPLREEVPSEALDELAATTGHPPRGVLVAVDGDESDSPIGASGRWLPRLAGVVAALRERFGVTVRLWILGSGEYHSALRSLVRVLAFEHPGEHVSLLEARETPALSLARELCADTPEDDVRWEGQRRRVGRLCRETRTPTPEGLPVRDGAYVITGGLGGLGYTFARELVRRGARRVVLNGRGAPTPELREDMDRLRERGAEVVVVNGDIAAPAVAERLVAAATEGRTELCGVLHAAGVVEDVAYTDLDERTLERVWRVKVDGALRLHEATRTLRPDWWAVFSSAAALLGSPGQAAYAAANGALDDLVRWRRAQGLPAISVQWGPWGRVGGASATFSDVLPPLAPETGVRAFEAALGAEDEVVGVAWLNATRVAERFPEATRRPFFREVLDTSTEEHTGVDLDRLRGLDPDQALRGITTRLGELLGRVSGTEPGSLDVDTALTGLGFDSLMAMRARNAVENEFGVTVPATLLLRGASTADLARHIAERLGARTVEENTGGADRVIGPRDATERWIARLWREALDVDEIGVDRDFFASGGDTSAAETVSAAVAERLGEEVAGLFEHPTVERMADLVRQRFEGVRGPVRWLRAEGGATPLFLFHPAGGPTSVYLPLTERLGPDQPCYGLERLDRFDTVEDKAEEYVGLIREIQPQGPYRLGGWSFGGCLAFETARRLTAAGDRVELVVLVDTILPSDSEQSRDELVTRRFERFVDHVEHTYGVSLPVSREELAELDETEQLERVMHALAESEAGIGRGVLRHQYTSYVDARIAERYRPGRYDGPVVLYRAERAEHTTTKLDPRYLRTDTTLGWDEFAGDLEVVRVPGDHLSMIDPPHVEHIAEHLRGLLRDGDRPEGE